MLVKTYASTVLGIEATTISIEVSVTLGTHYYIVGLPDNAIKESWQRIETAITEAGYKMPRQKIVVNLSPADVRKEGTALTCLSQSAFWLPPGRYPLSPSTNTLSWVNFPLTEISNL